VLLVLEVLVQAGTRAGRRIEALLAAKDFLPVPSRAALGPALMHALVWPALLGVFTVLLGLLPAVFLYVLLSLRLVGGKPLPRAAAIALAVTAGSWALFEWGMSYELYRGVLWGML
jgi:hypothetical protein